MRNLLIISMSILFIFGCQQIDDSTVTAASGVDESSKEGTDTGTDTESGDSETGCTDTSTSTTAATDGSAKDPATEDCTTDTGGTDTETPVDEVVAESCQPEHAGAIWTWVGCGDLGNLFSIPHDGMPSPNRGHLTFNISGLDRSHVPNEKEVYLVMAQMGPGDLNFHVNVWGSGGWAMTDFISQRHDGTCNPFCEQKNRQDSVQYDSSKRYQFDMQWDTANVSLTISDDTDPDNPVPMFVGTIGTDGPYGSMSYLNVGNGALPQFGQFPATLSVTDVRLSVLQ